jgi:putative toxin-antitoxin system antitoxin component (TIGR02293 family)
VNVLPKDIASVLGGKQTLGRDVRDYADLDAVIESGLPAAAVARVKELFKGREELELYRSLFMARHAGVDRSRKLERVARLYSLALSIFGDAEPAKEFLFTPHDRLGKRAPVLLAETELGLKQAEQILDAIAYGMPA